MKEKQAQMLHFLLEQTQAVPSRVLAETLDVSIRTVKNYISQLNQLSGEPVILSSNQGYKINREAARQLIVSEQPQEELPQNFKERAFYIIKKSLIEHQQLNLFDLSEELFVSYSTLKADITKMNKAFEKYHVKFLLKQDTLQIEGEEKEKRRLISYVIFEEVPQQFLDKDILEKNFQTEDIQKLTQIIQSLMKESNYQLNDFSFINLMIHLLILLESVRNNKSLITRNWFSSWLTEDKAKLVTKMIQRIEETFDLSLNRLEKEEIHMIFQANANYIPSNNLKELEQIVGADLMAPISQALEDVRRTFGINLTNESFVVPFSLHVSGLFNRAKQASFLKNPMLDSLKKDYPIVHDIAVFLALRLGDLLEITINEDECAYIALHIGSELEKQKKNFSKIRTVLLCPKYMNLDEKLYDQLNQHFGNELRIQSVISEAAELKGQELELLITTLPVPAANEYTVINVSPIFTEKQRLMLINELDTIRLDRKREILKANFDDFFDELFFRTETDAVGQQEILEKMCSQLSTHGIVGPEFYPHVLERETASSTAFESIAIPHSVYMEAQKTIISVTVSERGISWGDRKVHVVLLAAINDVDRRRFTDIYEGLISLFDSPQSYQEIRNVHSFEDFRRFIYSRIKHH
ncbi:transcriptional antiterminator [Enterococcus florum]|uniref:Transcriptional antiterminator n=1 Tax=Enterococcus florum TaxID=2480627 RepID=A0A4P5PF15_9ENTE|nr:PTS sugar transporter subunit IIA [Enterococcus florum]GCF95314.1 transcriptional antiterminator [Enterococcus florum]